MPRTSVFIGTVAVAFTSMALSSAQAALPPYYQRTAEIQAIINDQAVAAELEAKGPIEAIESTGPDAYQVRAGGCSLAVTIVDVPAIGGPMVGPRQFAVKVGSLNCP